MLGFDNHGNVVNSTETSGHEASTAQICERSSKIVSFFDFPGHERVRVWRCMCLQLYMPVCLCLWLWLYHISCICMNICMLACIQLILLLFCLCNPFYTSTSKRLLEDLVDEISIILLLSYRHTLAFVGLLECVL